MIWPLGHPEDANGTQQIVLAGNQVFLDSPHWPKPSVVTLAEAMLSVQDALLQVSGAGWLLISTPKRVCGGRQTRAFNVKSMATKLGTSMMFCKEKPQMWNHILSIVVDQWAVLANENFWCPQSLAKHICELIQGITIVAMNVFNLQMPKWERGFQSLEKCP